MDYGITRSYGSVAAAPANIRADFIRKVYHLFFLSVLVTVAVGWFCAQPSVAPALLGAFPVLLIGEVVCILALTFARRTSGLNVFLLYLFAAIQGAILEPVRKLGIRLGQMAHHAPERCPSQHRLAAFGIELIILA